MMSNGVLRTTQNLKFHRGKKRQITQCVKKNTHKTKANNTKFSTVVLSPFIFAKSQFLAIDGKQYCATKALKRQFVAKE